MASSSTPSTSGNGWCLTHLQSDTTYILYVSDEHDTLKKQFLVQKDTDMIVFLPEEDVKSDKIDPRRYHWHCTTDNGYFQFRNAFSKNLLRRGYYLEGIGHELTTDTKYVGDANFCAAGNSQGEFILYHNDDGDLLPVSYVYDSCFEFRYPLISYFASPVSDCEIIRWDWEEVENGVVGDFEVNYGPDDYWP